MGHCQKLMHIGNSTWHGCSSYLNAIKGPLQWFCLGPAHEALLASKDQLYPNIIVSWKTFHNCLLCICHLHKKRTCVSGPCDVLRHALTA